MRADTVVVGGGVFGLCAAHELVRRGRRVTVIDQGAPPYPLAESTDISKVVRMDYGADELYTALGERAIERWRSSPRYHETGVAFLARTPMAPGGFEYESFALLRARGHAVTRLDADAIADRFPAYRRGALVDGYTHAAGGWADASGVIEDLARGLTIEHGRVTSLAALGAYEHVVVCGGAWVPQLLPELAGTLVSVGQPVFHLVPPEPALFAAARFPVFGAAIARTGYYGFPVQRGVVKIANHGTGRAMSPDDPRDVTGDQVAALRAFLAATFPALAAAPIAMQRLCVYGDAFDGHFLIARHPERPRVTVACGGSGHAFKFAPVLGELIADAVDGAPGPERFAWRLGTTASRGDAARAR